MCISQNSISLLYLFQLISSNLPIGGFSYSRGLEFAIEFGWIKTLEDFLNWEKQYIYEQLVYVDWPLLKRCYYYSKIDNFIYFKKCAIKILEYRGTHEFRLEEQQRGKAISRLILQWNFPVADNWISAFEYSGLASIAWLGCKRGIFLENLSLGYAYNILEASVMVGVKLFPFGQKIAQQMLKDLIEYLPSAWNKSNIIKDDEIGNSFLLQSIASACHEIQYSRLFRS